jgi:hypothetical protein
MMDYAFIMQATLTMMGMQRMGSRAQQKSSQKERREMLKEVHSQGKMTQQRALKERMVPHLKGKVQRVNRMRMGQWPRERKVWSSWVRMDSQLHDPSAGGHHPSLRHPSTSRSWCPRWAAGWLMG